MGGRWRNHILQALRSSDFRLLEPQLQPVQLEQSRVLFQRYERIEYVYFPIDAVICFGADTGDGGQIEVWSVGSEGMAGISGLFGNSSPYSAFVQAEGTAMRGKATDLRRQLQSGRSLQAALNAYYETLVVQIAQVGVCNSLHDIEKRLCRWLLMAQDRVGRSQLSFTHESIAAFLGTRRASVSVAAAALQDKGVIAYTPGQIKIRSRSGLQARACHCYSIIKNGW